MVSLNRHGPAAKPGPGVVSHQRVADALEVEPEVVGHHEQLVGRRKADVTPRVREELGELRLLGLQLDEPGGQPGEQPARRGHPLRRSRGDDLGQLVQLGHGAALGNAFRAEAHDVVEPLISEVALDQRGDARVDGAAEHDHLATATEVIGKLRDRPDHRVGVGVEVLVHGCSDDHHHVLGGTDHAGLHRRGKHRGGAELGEGRLGALLVEGEPAGVDEVDGALVGVEEHNAHPAPAQRDAERQADVTTAADDDNVVLEGGVRIRLGSRRRRSKMRRGVGGHRRQPHMGRGDAPT
jgi:hypothetical protein